MVLATYDPIRLRLFGASLLLVGWLTFAMGVGFWLILAGIWVLVRSKQGNEAAIVCNEGGITARNPFFAATIPYARFRGARLARPEASPAWYAGFLALEADAGGIKGRKTHYLPLNLLTLAADGPAGIDRAIRECALKLGGAPIEAPAHKPAARAQGLTGGAPPPTSAQTSAPPSPAPSPPAEAPDARPRFARPAPMPIPRTLEGDRGKLH